MALCSRFGFECLVNKLVVFGSCFTAVLDSFYIDELSHNGQCVVIILNAAQSRKSKITVVNFIV